ncbi:uncharacterized protein BP01DRAFT_235402 [Aspergillus saccharolyticus JOP 1030-1]|uniref:Uncharacterized protein n=1 Tax=Aspergillus saccharolyticus JOP 1030-1 TaxID=1450539 RepID=A0A318ZIF8_9EURO|nr:hypothetical protein BP01DRAFT_235402 [Aspergillus saccharolyticus JOP 1030-1]PYH46705.1 hypothetical protein BP01DRAFT_235402 [Aspergillus saccharolyticus JOP 1030-1]
MRPRKSCQMMNRLGHSWLIVFAPAYSSTQRKSTSNGSFFDRVGKQVRCGSIMIATHVAQGKPDSFYHLPPSARIKRVLL